jgi:polysaccharide chain length determinant protein (PEP-CTERM system associated)
MDRWYMLVRKAGAIAWRRRWLLVAASWAICLLGWGGVHFIPDSYESEARLYVDTDAVLTPLLEGLAINTRTQSQLEMMQRTLLRRPNLDKLINITNLNLYATDPAARQNMLQQLGKAIGITSDGPNLFTVHYRNDNPQLAFQVVSGLVNIFMEEAAGSSMSDMQNAQRFLNEQIALFEKQLRAAEQRRAAFIRKYFEILPLAGSGGISPLDAAANTVGQLESQLTDALETQATLKEEDRITPPTLTAKMAGSMAAANANSPLAQAEAKLAELRARDTDQNPDVVAAEQEIAALKAVADRSPSGAAPDVSHDGLALANPAYEQLKLRLIENGTSVSKLQAQLDATRKNYAHIDAMVRSAPEVQAEYEDLDRGYGVLQKEYEELLMRRESSAITAAADTGADRVRLRIIDPPQVPIDPAAPDRLLLDSGVLLAGLAGAVGLALLFSQTDQSVSDVGQLRDLGVPVLGGISVVRSRGTRRIYFQGVSVATALVVLIVLYGGLMLHYLPHSKAFL